MLAKVLTLPFSSWICFFWRYNMDMNLRGSQIPLLPFVYISFSVFNFYMFCDRPYQQFGILKLIILMFIRFSVFLLQTYIAFSYILSKKLFSHFIYNVHKKKLNENKCLFLFLLCFLVKMTLEILFSLWVRKCYM